jgi:3-ketoacyl-CoA synthase
LTVLFVITGPYVLPLSEQIKVAISMAWKFIAKRMGSTKKIDMYMPDFKRGIDHFCIHAG